MADFYKRQAVDLKPWLLAAGIIFAAGFGIGIVLYIIVPGLMSHFADALKELAEKVSKDGKIQLTWQSVHFVFQQNFTAALIASFGGVIFGLPTIFIGLINFILLGFLAGLAIFGPEAGQLNLLRFVILTVPHGIFEITAILFSVALGLKLGILWFLPKSKGSRKKVFLLSLKQSFVIMPLIAVLLFVAAIIEIFVTGNISKFL